MMVAKQVCMDGSDGSTDLRMSVPDSTGVFVRTTSRPDGSLLLLGESLGWALFFWALL